MRWVSYFKIINWRSISVVSVLGGLAITIGVASDLTNIFRPDPERQAPLPNIVQNVTIQNDGANIAISDVSNGPAQPPETAAALTSGPQGGAAPLPHEIPTAIVAPVRQIERIKFPKGVPVEVCGNVWISARPNYDPSSGQFSKIEITLPNGDRKAFPPSDGSSLQIVPGCNIVSSEMEENRPNDPDSVLTFIQETSF